MGRASRANLASFDGGKRQSTVQKARLAKLVGQLRTQDQLDVFLESFPEHLRAQVHRVIEPMLPTLLPKVDMAEVYAFDPTPDTSWPMVKACSHRILRKLDCGCWAAGYGYTVPHATERVNQAAEAHVHEDPKDAA